MKEYEPTQKGVTDAWKYLRVELKDAEEVEKSSLVRDFFTLLARARSEGEIDSGAVDNFIGSASTLDSHKITKTELRGMYSERKMAVSNAEVAGNEAFDADIYTLDQLLVKRLETLRIIQSTDSNENAVYQWVIETPDGSVTVETNREHRAENHFRRCIFDATAEHIKQPDLESSWVEWIERFIMAWVDRNPHTKVTSDGPRTQAIDDFQRTVSSMTAVMSPETAYQMELLYLRDGETDDTIRVESRVVQRAVASHEAVSMQGLHAEMLAKEYLARKVEEETLEDGTIARWWCLKRDFAEPSSIEHDAEDVSLNHVSDDWNFGDDDE